MLTSYFVAGQTTIMFSCGCSLILDIVDGVLSVQFRDKCSDHQWCSEHDVDLNVLKSFINKHLYTWLQENDHIITARPLPLIYNVEYKAPYNLDYATLFSSGVDLRADINAPISLKPYEIKAIPTGVYLKMSPNLEAQVRPRSGLALKHGITVLNTPGTIDADYRGEIKVILINLGSEIFVIEPNMRIAQLVFVPVVRPNLTKVDIIDDDTERGQGGFGSTGLK